MQSLPTAKGLAAWSKQEHEPHQRRVTWEKPSSGAEPDLREPLVRWWTEGSEETVEQRQVSFIDPLQYQLLSP